MSEPVELTATQEEIKSCCAALYQSDLARMLLGESFHPGGAALTAHLGELLQLGPESLVLDVACGEGTSAIQLAQRFGCRVLGIDYGADAVWRANERARNLALAHLVSFQQGDAERLAVESAIYDVVLCECAFCTFPDKAAAVTEFARVLKPGGRIAMSDLVRSGDVPPELRSLLSWIVCIADAQPVDRYIEYLTNAGLSIERIEAHHEALAELVRAIQGRLLGMELLIKLKQVVLPRSIDFAQAKALVKAAASAVRAGQFGYVALVAAMPPLHTFQRSQQ